MIFPWSLREYGYHQALLGPSIQVTNEPRREKTNNLDFDQV